MDYYNKHYIRFDANNCIVKGFSDAFEHPEESDICINQEGGRHFELLGQVNPALFDGYGCPKYKYNLDTKIISETNNEEKQDELLSRKTLEQVQNDKIIELSFICNKTIESGFDVTVDTGVEHFSLTYYDQLHIKQQSDAVKNGAIVVPYHADGKGCRKYTALEMLTIATEAEKFVTYNTTYFNQAKQWIKACTSKEEVNRITWGVPLPIKYDNLFKSITDVSTITVE